MPDAEVAPARCRHYWFVAADRPDGRARRIRLVREDCTAAATGTIVWLGSRRYGHEDQQIGVCDRCRRIVETTNLLEQAERDGTLHQLLGN